MLNRILSKGNKQGLQNLYSPVQIWVAPPKQNPVNSLNKRFAGFFDFKVKLKYYNYITENKSKRGRFFNFLRTNTVVNTVVGLTNYTS